jgi:hypothetical protein
MLMSRDLSYSEILLVADMAEGAAEWDLDEADAVVAAGIGLEDFLLFFLDGRGNSGWSMPSDRFLFFDEVRFAALFCFLAFVLELRLDSTESVSVSSLLDGRSELASEPESESESEDPESEASLPSLSSETWPVGSIVYCASSKLDRCSEAASFSSLAIFYTISAMHATPYDIP